MTQARSSWTPLRPTPAVVLFERICRENGITQRLTRPRSPTTTGKIERLHQTLQLELPNTHEPFEDIEDAQAAVDAWREEYNADRPHQSLAMAFPAARFAPATRQVLGLRVPASAASAGPAEPVTTTAGPGEPLVAAAAGSTQPASCAVELDRVVPPSGNLQVALSVQAVANYIAKYATKALDAPGIPDRPIRSGPDLEALRCHAHYRRMITTAWRLGGGQLTPGPTRLCRWAHMLGYGGHFLTKSRRYTTTFGVLRRARTTPPRPPPSSRSPRPRWPALTARPPLPPELPSSPQRSDAP